MPAVPLITPTRLCLFIKCWLHGLGQAKQLRLATFQTHTCIWGVNVIFQVWCVLVTDCSISNNGGEEAGSRPPHIGIYLKLHTCLCPVTLSGSLGVPCPLLCSMHTPFAATWACRNLCGVEAGWSPKCSAWGCEEDHQRKLWFEILSLKS